MLIMSLFIYLFIYFYFLFFFLQRGGGKASFVWGHTSNSVLSFIIKTTLLHPGMFMLHSKTQLVEHRTGNVEVTGSNPVEA